MRRRLTWTIAVIAMTWLGGGRRADAACVATSVQVLVPPVLAPSDVIPVSWQVDPACAVIETGLLLGSDPAALTPVGSPIYGARPRYQQDLPVRESGTYWVAAYARDEAGEVVQSRPRSAFVVIPLRPLDDSRRLDEPSSLHLSGAHGPLPAYTGTDADFLQPAGTPHFAALRRITRGGGSSVINSVFRDGWGVAQARILSSTHRDEVLAQQAPPLMAGGVPLPVNPADVGTALGQLDTAFPALGYPRPGLYTVACQGTVFGHGQVIGTGVDFTTKPTCVPDTGVFGLFATYFDFTSTDFALGAIGLPVETSAGSGRSTVTYFIPKPPAGQRLQSARLRAFVTGRGDFSDFAALRLSGKPPAAVEPLCSAAGNGRPRGFNACLLWVTWDFTEEARALSAQGGGELELTLDPIPAAANDCQPGSSCIFERVAAYTLQLDVNYPWRHGTADNALTVTFEEACPQELEVSVTPSRVLPGLPPGFPEPWSQPSAPGSATMATVEARVKSCPTQALNSSPAASSTTASVVVTFEVQPPAAGSADAAGHLHSESRRPTGILRGQNGQKVTSCTATLDDQGMGACTVTYDAPESSGTETIVARAPGFNDAQTRVTVVVPGLQDLAAVQSLFAPFYRLVGRVPGLHTDNHWGTTQTVRAAQLVARDYAQIFSASLQINDMSLPQGGLFDICGTWNRSDRCGNAPNGGHYFHRKGTSVDFNHNACLNPLAQDLDNLFGDCNSGFVKVDELTLAKICHDNGGWRVPEGPIHCELP